MAEVLQFRIDMEPQSRWRIVTVDPAAKNGLLHVQETGEFFARGGYYTTRQGLDSYLLKLTLAGRGVLEYGGSRYVLNPGDLFWIHCQQPQHYYTDQETGRWRVLWVHFWGPSADAYYQAFLTASHGSPVGRLPDRSGAVRAMEKLLALYDRTGSDLMADVQAAAVLAELLAGCIQAQEAAPTAPRAMLEIRDFLTEHYGEPVTLDSLSARFSLSKYHLQRSFKRYFGQSPGEYLTAVRLANAKRLLRTTELPVSEVAYAVGYETASHFIRLFRSQEELTPQKYRKTWANA